MRSNRRFLRGMAAAAFLCLTGSLAFGQATRTWVSGVGDDANPCSRTAPCKTFAGAISKTAVGGEIDVLDPGGFGAVTITKSISIEAVGVVAGVLVSGTNGIVVSAPGAVVVLRGLTFDGLGTGLSGVDFLAGSALYVEDCTINNFQTGINIKPSSGQSHVFISDTVVRNNSNDGILFAPSASANVSGTLKKVRTENNGAAGVEADGSYPANADVILEGTTSANNAIGVFAKGTYAKINMSNVDVFDNAIGLLPQSGNIVSFGNNRITDNGINGSPSQTITQQ
jgi:hypothetical protein